MWTGTVAIPSSFVTIDAFNVSDWFVFLLFPLTMTLVGRGLYLSIEPGLPAREPEPFDPYVVGMFGA